MLNFHKKYILNESRKLGEGQHAMVYECYLKEEWESLKKKSINLQLPGSKSLELDSNKSDLDENDQKPFDVVKTELNFEK